MRLVSKVYSYNMSQRLKRYRDILYTAWVRGSMGSMGGVFSISYPCKIQADNNNLIVGDGSIIYSHCVLECWNQYIDQSYSPSLIIGNNCRIGEYNHITAIDRIEIGDNLLTGRYVIIADHNHGGFSKDDLCVPPAMRKLKSKGGIIIGKNVWLGDKVTILSGVHIGDNVIVGANSVVTNNIPANCVVAGAPARIVKRID